MKRYWLALLVLLVTSLAAAAPGHTNWAWVRTALDRLPVFHEDRGLADKPAELDAVAAAVAEVSRNKPLPPQRWAALVLTVGFHESGFSSRIIANQCRKHECDGGRARGFGQVHANALNRAEWERAPGDVALQAKLVSDALVRGYWTCARSGVEPVRGTLNGYAGVRCNAAWPGLEKRLATFARVVRQ